MLLPAWPPQIELSVATRKKMKIKVFFPSLHVRGIILVASIASECDLRF